MALGSLSGRIPRITSAMSPRLIYIGVALAVAGVCFVIYGFHYRIAKKQEQKSAATAQITSADAATSNRAAVQGSIPGTTVASNLGGTPTPTTAPPASPASSVIASGSAQLGNAVKAVASPFGSSGSQTVPPVNYAALTLPANYSGLAMQTPVDQTARRHEQAYERRLAAIDAPTSESTSTSLSAPSGTPSASSLQAQADQSAAELQANLNKLRALSNGVTPTAPVTSQPSGYGRPDEEDDTNGQGAKRTFQQQGSDGDYLHTTRTAPLSPWVVERGEFIPAGLPNQIVSDLPGDLVAVVKRDVYDSPSHRFVLIPAGSLLAGEYNSGVTYGQKRVQVIWTYLRFPDGSYIDLDKFVGHSGDGSAGLGDQVDNHIKRLIGGIAMSSLFAAGVQISQNHTNAGGSTLAYPSNTQIAASAAGQQAAEVGQQITSRNLQVQPTIKIRPGDVFYVSVMKSIIFPGPYRPLEMVKAK